MRAGSSEEEEEVEVRWTGTPVPNWHATTTTFSQPKDDEDAAMLTSSILQVCVVCHVSGRGNRSGHGSDCGRTPVAIMVVLFACSALYCEGLYV